MITLNGRAIKADPEWSREAISMCISATGISHPAPKFAVCNLRDIQRQREGRQLYGYSEGDRRYRRRPALRGRIRWRAVGAADITAIKGEGADVTG
jgi:hypothetical protein